MPGALKLGAAGIDTLAATALTLKVAGTARVTLHTNGAVGFGTLVTTGTISGNTVVPNNRAHLGVNIQGTGTIAMIKVHPDNWVSVAPDSIVGYGGVTVVAAAAAGDGVHPNGRGPRVMNAAGTSTLPLGTIDASNIPRLGYAGEVTGIGSGATAPVASAGRSGGLFVDTANNRLYVYSGANRYTATLNLG